MLALVPDNSDVRPPHALGILYVDYRALETVQGVAKPASGSAFGKMSGDAQWRWYSAFARGSAAGLNPMLLDHYLRDMPTAIHGD
jgi:hypothetical protein